MSLGIEDGYVSHDVVVFLGEDIGTEENVWIFEGSQEGVGLDREGEKVLNILDNFLVVNFEL